MSTSPVPRVRRILIDEPPTVVEPSVGGDANGNGHAAPASAVAPSGLRRATRSATTGRERMRTHGLSILYDGVPAVRSVDLPVREGEVLALIGPSGCGKTTLLRSLNRLTELTATATREGTITLDDEDVDQLEVTDLRKRVSMVFQQPNPFPMSIFDNVAYALREQGTKRPRKAELETPVEDALRRAGLWEEVRDRLDAPALRLSGGQQQRLCIARSLAARPEVLLLDEPASALDPRSTATIEDLVVRLRDEVAVVIVTHNLQQAYRIADEVAFMWLGELEELGPAEQVFHRPRMPRTVDYVRGAFG